jgi:pimeloyl-ACP methyl ester carboxylesterase
MLLRDTDPTEAKRSRLLQCTEAVQPVIIRPPGSYRPLRQRLLRIFFMLAHALRLLLLVEAAGYWALAHAMAGAPALGIALAIAALALGWRLLPGVVLFVVAGALQRTTKAARLPCLRSLRIGLREALAIAYVYTVLMPFLRFAPAPMQGQRGECLPVILVHGIYCNGAIWRPVAKSLRGAGVAPVVAPDLDPLLGSIDEQACGLAAVVAETCRAHAAEQAVVIAHSMGGLVARRMIATAGGSQVARLVTIGTPHHGTRLAALGIGRAPEQMRPRCAWLGTLETAERSVAAPPIVSIYSRDDEIVVPASSARLEGARNIALSGHGHIALLFSEDLPRLLLAEIAAARSASRA